MARRTVLILTGEPSGDRAGGGLARALRRQHPDLRILAVGGRELAAAGAEILEDIANLSAMGFVEVLRQIPRLDRLERRLHRVIERERPDVVVPIDYPGFHLRIARWTKGRGPRVVYYIGPQVWAWGRGRLPKIASAVDRMLVVFPFEVDLYREAGVPVDYVGHPLVESLDDAPPPGVLRGELGATNGVPVLGLLPGSRVQEVRRLLPVMIEAAQRARGTHPDLRVVVSRSGDVPRGEYADAEKAGLLLRDGPAASIITGADALLVTSGTATLESALLGTPLAVLYRTSPVTWWIGRRVVKIERISLANIVAGEDLAPEFLQHDATAERVAAWVEGALDDPEAAARARAGRERLRAELGPLRASEEAARIVLEEAER